MKTLKHIISQIQSSENESSPEFKSLLWKYICYSPKMAAHLQQQQLLDLSEIHTLKVNDPHFAKGDLNFNTFKWGKGKHKILLTHGWGSKAIDFSDIITSLSQNEDFEIIAFDAPGSGSSEGELSNLLLFVQAIKAIVTHYGQPNILIGHSLGALANIIAMKDLQIKPSVLISLTPLLKLKENFEASMNAVGISPSAQADFLNSFAEKFGVAASHFELVNWYGSNGQTIHWVGYDVNDKVLPFSYLQAFLEANSEISSKNYEDTGHERIIKFPAVIEDIFRITTESIRNY